MGSNRYTQLQPTEFDAPLFQPNWEALDQSLQQQQGMYDITKSLDEKVPKHLQAHSEDAMRYKQSVSEQIDKVAESYRTQDLATANKSRNELLRKVAKDWMPGGEAYALEDAYNTVQSLVGKYDELYKDDPSYMNKAAQNDIQSQIKKWDYDPKTGKYSKVSDPMYSEYFNIQKEAHEYYKGMMADATQHIDPKGHVYWKRGDEIITEKSIRDSMQQFLSQERYKQQLSTEKWSKFGHREMPKEMLAQQTEQARTNALSNIDSVEADVLSGISTMSKEEATKWQELLSKEGYYSAKIDGDFGAKSQEALGKYFDDKRTEAQNTEITDEHYNQLVKEEYIKPMVEIHAYHKHTEDVKESAFAIARMRAAAKKSAINALLATIPTKDNTGLTMGVTVHQTYDDLTNKLHDAKLDLESSKNNIGKLYSSDAYRDAFGTTLTKAGTPGPDGRVYNNTTYTINTEKAIAVNPNAIASYQDAVKSANKSVGEGNTNSPAYMKAVSDSYVAIMKANAEEMGITYSDEQLKKQAAIMNDANNRDLMYNAQTAYYNNKTRHDDIEIHKNDMVSKYSAAPEANKIQSDYFSLATDPAPKMNNPSIWRFIPNNTSFNGIDLNNKSIIELKKLRTQLNNPVLLQKWASHLNISPDELAKHVPTLDSSIADMERHVSKNIEKWVSDTNYQYSQPSTVVSGQTAHEEFGKDVLAMVNDSDASRLIQEANLDDGTLEQIGYNADGTKKDKHKLSSGTIAFKDIGGRQTMVFHVTADWEGKGGKTGQALIPMARISSETRKAMYAKYIGMQMTQVNGKPNAQGVIASPGINQQQSLLAGHGWFDDYMSSDNPKLSSVYVQQNPIKQGQSRSLGSFNNISSGGSGAYVIEYKPTVSGGLDSNSDFFIFNDAQYEEYIKNNRVIPQSTINDMQQKGKQNGTAFDDLETLKKTWGRVDLTKYATQNPNYSSHKVNDANAGVMGAAGAMIGSDDTEPTEDTYFEENK